VTCGEPKFLASPEGDEEHWWKQLGGGFPKNQDWRSLRFLGKTPWNASYNRPSASVHPARQFLSTASTAHTELARYWLAECLQKHPQCGTHKPIFRPTRLLFFPNGAASHVRVDASANGDEKIAYFALSHCWGGAERHIDFTMRQHF
jgi:hypothetical protein